MLKKTSVDQRTLFLQLFTKELLSNSIPTLNLPKIEELPEEKMELSPIVTPKFNIEEEPKETYEASMKKEVQPQIPISKKPIAKKRLLKPKKMIQTRKRAPIVKFRKRFTAPIKNTKNIPHIPTTKPVPGQGIDLGRLNNLVADKEITIIECPGADKFVLVKKAGKINLTKTKLSKEEIDKIINNFSEGARIPLMEGVFKAIVGEFSISAVITESIGNRFLIYKKTPYSIIDS